MPARIRPRIIVAIAAQRNQKSAAGAITLVIAGFSASGIFGMDGVCTKLKYHRRPIHITPLATCSQRMAKNNQACSLTGMRAPAAAATMMSRTMRTTTPAVMVRPREAKNAAIVFSFVFVGGGASEKSLHRSPAAGQHAARGEQQHEDLGASQRKLQPVALREKFRQQPRVAR